MVLDVGPGGFTFAVWGCSKFGTVGRDCNPGGLCDILLGLALPTCSLGSAADPSLRRLHVKGDLQKQG